MVIHTLSLRMIIRISLVVSLMVLGGYLLIGSSQTRREELSMDSKRVSLMREQASLRQEIMALNKDIDFFEQEAFFSAEKIAREELLMGREHEVVYIYET